MLIISKQGYEESIENMKIQFAAISEEKAEVERKIEPLEAESAELKKQADEFDNRKQRHAVSSFLRPALLSRYQTAVIVTDRESRHGAHESNQRCAALSKETYRRRGCDQRCGAGIKYD